MKTVPIKPVTCPGCDFTYNFAGAATGQKGQPKPGHFVICFKCGQILTFNLDLTVTIPSTDELAGLKKRSPFLYDQISAASAAVRKQRKTELN